ncbi:esterase/lipase family protein [Polyangium aurulentum]|uniref:esterase/lipase family protein n=1 Tax=Polyangium aurulentum TaxID=2567896 RepID=UPI0010ADC5CF|nr:alpha/beta hydrolase [Polyangium aurulentum]UQA57793.1 alpha/beta hydrolase [Polyangium aurulentum]
MRSNLERVIGVLNGAVGDYLQRTGNGLATPMQLVLGGKPVELSRGALAAAYPKATGRVAVLVHGLMCVESVWNMPGGETYGSLLARDLGYTPVYLRYNSGLHISENGEGLDALLGRLVNAYPVPVEELLLIGHSMGGLVLRSATHAASEEARSWLSLVRRAFYIGTPHLGAPLERFGNLVSWTLQKVGNPYTTLIADIMNLRSSGVKDLRFASLRREDWDGADADALLMNRRHPVPLLPQIRHHLIAGTVSADPRLSLLFGDALVAVASATGRAKPKHRCSPFPQEHVRIMAGMDHMRIARAPEVYAQIRAWCEEAG